MFYQRTSFTSVLVIPEELIQLFEYYEVETPIIAINEFPEKYIIANKILNEKKNTKTFTETLFTYMDNSNIRDTEIYKKATIDKRLFSKIRSNYEYHPSFGTVTLLALALKLTTEEYEHLLESASYSLPQNSYANITLKYCFDNKINDVVYVNSLVFEIVHKQIKEL
ncbi:MAG: hypothetical protein IJH12_04940 [Clostridia bacterium]|nr:hypothetical protein [Clostridia bacterium]